jgi:CHAT domain-containing protein
MAEIRQKFPEYADLTAPKSVTISEVQSALRPGEALISILPTEEQTLIWAIPAKGQVSFATSGIGTKEINSLVGTLRQSLDPGEFSPDQMPAFDPQAAHRLFTSLLQPVAAGWKGAEHIFVATGGALGRLPLAVLLTEPLTDSTTKTGLPLAHYRNWPWLIRHHAISQLPSAASLLTLRRMAKGASNRSPFVGFGDPDFSGSGKTAGTTRGLRAVIRSDNNPQEIDYSTIPPLPDTRVEILALAETLHANLEHDVYLGKQASRDNVLKADLSKRKIVAFATHGLLTGEYPGVDQPALALANPGGGKHGLLLLDDILTLKLDADWVILSACNTAGGDGHGGEAISGLGRGFFYSGSRSLLVTHWPVESVSAQKLVVGIFEQISKNPNYSRANALRQSMLQLMNSDGKDGKFSFAYAHPLFWAPYTLVGDGGN